MILIFHLMPADIAGTKKPPLRGGLDGEARPARHRMNSSHAAQSASM